MITHKTCAVSKTGTVRLICPLKPAIPAYSGLNLIHDNAVGVPVQLGKGVGAEQYGRAAPVEFAHDFVKHLSLCRVEAGCRFVKQQDFGLAQQGLCQGKALAHPFRISADAAVCRL